MISSVLYSLSLLLAFTVQPVDKEQDKAKTDIEKRYQVTFSSFHAPLVVEAPYVWTNDGELKVSDIPQYSELPKQVTERALISLSALFGKEVSRIDGGYLLSRPKDRLPANYNRNGDWVSWLQSIGVEELKSLASSYRSFSELDSYGQALVSQGCQGPGLYGRIQEGKEVKVKVIQVLKASFVNPKTGRKDFLILGGGAFDDVPWDQSEQGSVVQEPEIVGPSDGKLEYAEGKLTTYRGFVADAMKVFGCRLLIDPRFDRFPLFVKGNFTKERFLAIFKDLYKGVSPLELLPAEPPEQEYQKLLNQLLDMDLSGKDFTELVRRCLDKDQQINCSELKRLFPKELTEGTPKGLADNTSFTLTADLCIRVYAPGLTRVGKDSYVSNDTRISLKPLKSK